MINQNQSPTTPQETTISRQTRNAFVTAIVFTFAALINFVASLRVSLETGAIVSYIDTLSVFLFFIFSIYAAALIRKGEKDRAIWQLVFMLIVVVSVRNFVNDGMAYVFAVLVAVLIPFVALLALKPESFNKALAVGLAAASSFLIFDILINRFVPSFRQGGESIALMSRMVTVIAILLAISYFYMLARQSRYLLLSSKLTLGMTMIVLVPLIVLGIATTASLTRSLIPRQQQVMTSRTAYLAANVDVFLDEAKRTVVGEAGSEPLQRYIHSDGEGVIVRSIRAAETRETLLSYRRKDILNIESYAILDENGNNVLDTNEENIGLSEGDKEYFVEPMRTGQAYISNIQRNAQRTGYNFVVSAPIISEYGTHIGVLRAIYKIDVLQQFYTQYTNLTVDELDADLFAALLFEIPANQLDETDPEKVYLILANTSDPALNFKVANRLTTNVITPLQTGGLLPPGSTAQLSLNLPGIEQGLIQRETNPVFEGQAYPRENQESSIQDMILAQTLSQKEDWVVITSQNVASVNKPVQEQRETITFITVFIAAAAAILAYFSSRMLLTPILNLTELSEKVSKGDFSSRAVIDTEDEVGVLGQTFNTMLGQLDSLVTTLEDRVELRTKDLERRAQQLQAAVEVGKVAASLRNLDNLLTQATELISLRFGFYHTGIFLLDEKNEYAVLRAANSEGGKRMLKRNHKLKVGQVGIVGYVTETGQARIALDVGQDAVYFDNPDLPETRSEMALALIAGGKILGALDIQSTQGEAFSEADITTLQVLADQIAISIENARLFEENRSSLQALRRAYGEQSYIGWKELMRTRKHYGYQGRRDGSVVPITDPATAESLQEIVSKNILLDDTHSTANIPIMVRGNPIGMLRLSKPETAHSWTENELELARILSTELSGALDSARLFDETRKQAEQEYVVGEITDKMRESMNVESIIKRATEEIYSLLDLEHIAIHFTPKDDSEEDA